MNSHSQENMDPLWEASSRQDHCLEGEACAEIAPMAKRLRKQETRLEWEGSDEQLV